MFIRFCHEPVNKYRGFHLEWGWIYGRDDVSPFATMLIRDPNGRTGMNATILMWRLDMESTRGWYTVWEKNATTMAAIRCSMDVIGNTSDIKKASIARDVPRNSLSYVKRHSLVRVF